MRQHRRVGCRASLRIECEAGPCAIGGWNEGHIQDCAGGVYLACQGVAPRRAHVAVPRRHTSSGTLFAYKRIHILDFGGAKSPPTFGVTEDVASGRQHCAMAHKAGNKRLSRPAPRCRPNKGVARITRGGLKHTIRTETSALDGGGFRPHTSAQARGSSLP
eukprot:scaffold15973_cov137-Isochrysis_galbana.AAC.6